MPAWRWWYVGPVVVGNVGDNSASSYRLHASQKHNSWPTPHPSVICMELLRGSRQPMTGPLQHTLATQRLGDRRRRTLLFHGHTHPFNGPFLGTTQVSRYQKGKINLDFTEARNSWVAVASAGPYASLHSLQTDNHASTPPLGFLQAGCPSCLPTNSVKALKALLFFFFMDMEWITVHNNWPSATALT